MRKSVKFCRLGHTIPCSQEGEIITEIAESDSNNDFATPEGISLESGLAMAISWDN